MCIRQAAIALLFATHSIHAQADQSNIVILQGAELPEQCSRSSPPAADGTWNPTQSDVDALEALLSSVLSKSRRAQGPDVRKVLSRSARQYFGLMRGGKRYLYGNFFPATTVRAVPEWRIKPVVVCDGGHNVFGVELDLQMGIISHFAVNGP